MPSLLIFYTNPMSRGQIIRWMLEEAGAPYEQELLDFDDTGMKGDAYLAINPMGKVPAIKHDNKIVTECAAICAYLADAFPEAELAPRDDECADYYRWLFFAAGPVEQAITDRNFGLSLSEGQERSAGYGSYDKAVAVLEGAVTGRDYICGDRFTAADVYVGSQIDWGLQFGTLPSLPAFEAYAARLRERDAYKRAKAIDAELMPEQPAAT